MLQKSSISRVPEELRKHEAAQQKPTKGGGGVGGGGAGGGGFGGAGAGGKKGEDGGGGFGGKGSAW